MRHLLAVLALTFSGALVAGEPSMSEPASLDWWRTAHPGAIHWSAAPTAFPSPALRGRGLLSGIPVSRRVRLLPDVQVLKGGRSDGDNSLVAGVRMKIAF
jgi:hypothetical protein